MSKRVTILVAEDIHTTDNGQQCADHCPKLSLKTLTCSRYGAVQLPTNHLNHPLRHPRCIDAERWAQSIRAHEDTIQVRCD